MMVRSGMSWEIQPVPLDAGFHGRSLGFSPLVAASRCGSKNGNICMYVYGGRRRGLNVALAEDSGTTSGSTRPNIPLLLPSFPLPMGKKAVGEFCHQNRA